MIIGIPKECKSEEYRVGLLPVGADLLVQDGHRVLIERGAGRASGFLDSDYQAVGAEIVADAATVYGGAELICKVKEPQPAEIDLLQPGQVVFGYFHFAADRDLTERCLQSGVTALAFETLHDRDGRLPLLTPMSEVAGKMCIQEGAKFLEMPMMGRGILLGGVPGVQPANVLILGAGVVGSQAARMAAGLGANVFLLDIDLDRLRYLDDVMPANVTTIYSDPHALRWHSELADLVIGSVLIPGDRAPRLLNADHVKRMRPGSVIVDVCIDQGGCIETARPTTHATPTYIVDEVVHYCVANIPGAVSRTSSQALANATLPYIRNLARMGVDRWLERDDGHAAALNVAAGEIVHPGVVNSFPDLPFRQR